MGVMDLAYDGAVIPLDGYLDLIPNVVSAVGEDGMSCWRHADGHIYTIPTVINMPGAQIMMAAQTVMSAARRRRAAEAAR